jgi:hypothetical protein
MSGRIVNCGDYVFLKKKPLSALKGIRLSVDSSCFNQLIHFSFDFA